MGVLTPEHAFISYSHLDQMIAQRVRDDLEAAGIKIWIDEQIEPGTPAWDHAIRDAITGSFAVILIGSPHAKDGLYVPDELQIAARQGRDIIPLWLAGNDWTDCAPLGWGRAQYINCCGDQYTTGITQLAKKLQQIIDARSPAMQPLTEEETINYHRIIDVDVQYNNAIIPFRQDYIYVELATNSIVAIRYGAYNSIGDLLDTLYMEYLRKRYPPYTYGNQWILGVHADDYSTLTQLLAPWEWLLLPKGSSIVEIRSDWSNFSPRTWFASPRLRNVRVFDKVPQIACGILGNLLAENISFGKRGYALRRTLHRMINNHSSTFHLLGHPMTISDKPEEMKPQDYQHHFIVTFDDEGDQHDYVQPGEVDRIVCVISG